MNGFRVLVLGIVFISCEVGQTYSTEAVESCNPTLWSRPTIYDQQEPCEPEYNLVVNACSSTAVKLLNSTMSLEDCKDWCSQNAACSAFCYGGTDCLWDSESNQTLSSNLTYNAFLKDISICAGNVLSEIPEEFCTGEFPEPDYINKWYCQWNHNSMATHAYFSCPTNTLPSSSENYYQFTNNMPEHIFSAYEDGLSAMINCCKEDANIIEYQEWELLPYFCQNDESYDIFQSAIESDCNEIRTSICDAVYGNNNVGSTVHPTFSTATSYVGRSSSGPRGSAHINTAYTTHFSPSWHSSSWGMGSSYFTTTSYQGHSNRHSWSSSSYLGYHTTHPRSSHTSSWMSYFEYTTQRESSISYSWTSYDSNSMSHGYNAQTQGPHLLGDISSFDNEVMAQFIAYYTYHSSSLSSLLNTMLQCPKSSILPEFITDFLQITTHCQSFFQVEVDKSILTTIFEILNYPNPLANEDIYFTLMVEAFSKLSPYQNCHTFFYYIYQVFNEALLAGVINIPENCEIPYGWTLTTDTYQIYNTSTSTQSTVPDLGQSKDAEISSSNQLAIILLGCNSVAVIILIILIAVCVMKQKRAKRLARTCQQYRIPVKSISMQIPPLSKGNESYNKPILDFEPIGPKLASSNEEGNPFPPRYSFSSLRSSDPIVDAWDNPMKLSTKSMELEKEWLDTREKRRESMFCVTTESNSNLKYDVNEAEA